MKTADVFLSYSRADKKRVDELVAALQEAEFQVWFDEGGQHGPKYTARIEAAIKECKVFLLISSKAALRDERVKGQCAMAQRAKRQIQTYQIEDLPAADVSAAAVGDLNTLEAFGEYQNSSIKRLLAALEDAGVEKRPPEVFISYSSKDAKLVHRIAQNLRNARVPIWIDRAKIWTGADWDTQIVQALKSCKIVLLARSTHSLKSDPVAQELKLAKDLGKRILQLRLSGPHELPDNLAFVLVRNHFLDVERDREDVILEKLLKELANLDKSIESDERAIEAAREEQQRRKRRRQWRLRLIGTTVVSAIGAFAWLRPNPVWAGEIVAIPAFPAGIFEHEGANGTQMADVEFWHTPTSEVEMRLGIARVYAVSAPTTESLAFDRDLFEGTGEQARLLKGMKIEARLFMSGDLRGRYRFELGGPLARNIAWDTSHAVLLRVPHQYLDRDEVTISLRGDDERSAVLPAVMKLNTRVNGAVLIGNSLAGMERSSSKWQSELPIVGNSERNKARLKEIDDRWRSISRLHSSHDLSIKPATLIAVLEVVDPDGKPIQVGRSKFELGDDLFVDVCIDATLD